MSQKDFVINALNRAFEIASIQRNEFVTPEHIIYAITEHVPFREVCQKMDYDIDEALSMEGGMTEGLKYMYEILEDLSV